MFKSVLSVVAGYAVLLVVTMILFALLAQLDSEAFGREPARTPGTGVLLLILAVGLGAAAGGGWVTARLAPRAAGRHVHALAAFVLVMSAVTFFADSGGRAPGWYLAGLAVVGVGGVLLGGRLRSQASS